MTERSQTGATSDGNDRIDDSTADRVDDDRPADTSRRGFLAGGATLGLASLGSGGWFADGDGEDESPWARDDHDHSGEYGATDRLGVASPVTSIDVASLSAARINDVVQVSPGDDLAAAVAGLESGQRLELAPGTYTLSSTLSPGADDVEIVGCGRDVTTVELAPGADTDLLAVRGRTGVTVRDLALDQRGGEQSAGRNVVVADGARDVRFDGVEFRNAYQHNLLVTGDAQRVLVEHCVCRDWSLSQTGDKGVWILSGSGIDTLCEIRDTDFVHFDTQKDEFGEGYGIPIVLGGRKDTAQADNNVVTGCRITGGGAKGLAINGSHNVVGPNLYYRTAGSAFEIQTGDHNSVTGGTAYETGDNGFSIYRGASHNTVTGFTVYRSAFNGASISGGVLRGTPSTDHNTLENCTFYDCGQDQTGTYKGVRIVGKARENSIQDCVVYGSELENAFRVQANNYPATDNSFEQCRAVGAQRHGILVVGPKARGTTVRGCWVKNAGQAGGTRGWAGIALYKGDDTRITGNRVWDDQDAPTQQYGISTFGGNAGVVVTDNDLRGNGTGAVSFGSPDDAVRVDDNRGFATGASGSATVADGDTIAHGLAVAPSAVTLTPSAADRHVAATAVDDESVTVGLTDASGERVETTETVYWSVDAY